MNHLISIVALAIFSFAAPAVADSLPAPLELRGPAPGYAILATDLARAQVTLYDGNFREMWRYDRVNAIDAWAMADGTLLIAYLPSGHTAKKGGVRLVGRDKKTVFDFPFDDEIMSVQPLENGNFLLAECHYARIGEFNRKGERVGSFQLLSKPNGHQGVRHIRLTAKGTVVAAECYSDKLREYDRKGALLREIDFRHVYYPEPLSNGHILASSYYPPHAKMVEFDETGKPLWTIGLADLPADVKVGRLSSVTRLPSGNILVASACSPGNKAKQPRTMLFEITPDKKVVWQVNDGQGGSALTTAKYVPEAVAGLVRATSMSK